MSTITNKLIRGFINHYRAHQQHKDTVRLHPEDYATLLSEPESRTNVMFHYGTGSDVVITFRGIPVVIDRTAPRIDSKAKL